MRSMQAGHGGILLLEQAHPGLDLAHIAGDAVELLVDRAQVAQHQAG